jgi:endonuclease G
MTEFKGLLRYGNPGPVFDVGARSAFVSSYDRRMRNPAWVYSPTKTDVGCRGDYKGKVGGKGR